MKNLPVQIKQKSFERRLLGGLKKAEVQSYLENLSSEWENLETENSRLSVELKRMKDMEVSLLQALEQVERNKEETLRQAKKEADLTIKEAELTKDLLVKEAEHKATEMMMNAKQEHQELVSKQKKQTKTLRDDFDIVDKHTDAMIDELNRIMRETSETINRLTKIKKVARYQYAERNIESSPQMFVNHNSYKAEKFEEKRAKQPVGQKAPSRPQPVAARPAAKRPQPQQVKKEEGSTLLEKLQNLNEEKTLHDKYLDNFLNKAHSA